MITVGIVTRTKRVRLGEGQSATSSSHKVVFWRSSSSIHLSQRFVLLDARHTCMQCQSRQASLLVEHGRSSAVTPSKHRCARSIPRLEGTHASKGRTYSSRTLLLFGFLLPHPDDLLIHFHDLSAQHGRDSAMAPSAAAASSTTATTATTLLRRTLL